MPQVVRWTRSSSWSAPHPNVTSTLVVGAPNGRKQDSVRGIVDWLHRHEGLSIKAGEVYFFDDYGKNPAAFAGTGFNARLVSCSSRDEHGLGLCGGRSEEVVKASGVQACE